MPPKKKGPVATKKGGAKGTKYTPVLIFDL